MLMSGCVMSAGHVVTPNIAAARQSARCSGK
jgi:hypothetical protein